MKLKLDENIGRRGQDLLKTFGHDVMTVRDQLRFPPEKSAGIAILETGRGATAQGLLDRLRDLAAVLETRSLAGELWVVEPGRIRIHLREGDTDIS